MINLKSTDCLKLEYECEPANKEFMVESELQFTAQTPKDGSLLERAILVNFRTKGVQENFKFICVCRVIFSFDLADELLEGKELIKAYQSTAYVELQKIGKNVLGAVSQNKNIFPEYQFD